MFPFLLPHTRVMTEEKRWVSLCSSQLESRNISGIFRNISLFCLSMGIVVLQSSWIDFRLVTPQVIFKNQSNPRRYVTLWKKTVSVFPVYVSLTVVRLLNRFKWSRWHTGTVAPSHLQDLWFYHERELLFVWTFVCSWVSPHPSHLPKACRWNGYGRSAIL